MVRLNDCYIKGGIDALLEGKDLYTTMQKIVEWHKVEVLQKSWKDRVLQDTILPQVTRHYSIKSEDDPRISTIKIYLEQISCEGLEIPLYVSRHVARLSG